MQWPMAFTKPLLMVILKRKAGYGREQAEPADSNSLDDTEVIWLQDNGMNLD